MGTGAFVLYANSSIVQNTVFARISNNFIIKIIGLRKLTLIVPGKFACDIYQERGNGKNIKRTFRNGEA